MTMPGIGTAAGPTREPRTTLFGRERESADIVRLLDAARGGESRSLVVRGAPGVGKSALLSFAAERAHSGLILRTAGVQTESDLAFAGLYGLFRPLSDRIDQLPGRQADALAGVLGLRGSAEIDRLLVCAATLSMLARAAEDRLLVCLIDDLQWLDSASAEALLFSARRLRAEPIAMLFTCRDGPEGPSLSLAGIDRWQLGGLPPPAARRLIQRVVPRAAPSAVDWLLKQAEGNPLALTELPGQLTEGELDGRAPLPELAPLSTRLRTAFRDRIDDLSDESRAALLIAAIEDDGDAPIAARAAGVAGLSESALDASERAGLITISDGVIAFRHPLVRSAILEASTHAERRHAHAALAAALSAPEHADRRIWHQALASLTPDANVASALEASARRAQARAAHASAATAFARAAELSAEEMPRSNRLLASAQAAWAAGDPDRAKTLVLQALPRASGRTQAELMALRGRIEARAGDLRGATALLVEAADASDDASLTLELLTDAAEAATDAGDHSRAMVLGERASAVEPRNETDRFRAEALTGLGAAVAGDHQRAAALLSAASERAERLEDPRALVLSARMATLAGIHGDGLPQAARAVALARERSLLSLLPAALEEYATALIGHSRFSLAYVAAEESLTLARDLGAQRGAMSLVNLASIDALRGDEERSRMHAEAAINLATASGAALIVGFARRTLALLDLSLGRPGEATDRLLPLSAGAGPGSDPIIALWSTPDLIEAAARAGRIEEVTAQLERFRAWADGSPSRARIALLARCEALVGADDVRHRFEIALAHADAQSPFQQARTELLYGEWLRRAREPRAAREHLRSAVEQFRVLGTRPWEDRAQTELRATGESIRRRDPTTLDELTSQELQIAGLVASGLTNRQIAAQLYLSPRTVEYHLRKVFTKLGISSRVELVQMGVPTTD